MPQMPTDGGRETFPNCMYHAQRKKEGPLPVPGLEGVQYF